jgi:hypothetical protein
MNRRITIAAGAVVVLASLGLAARPASDRADHTSTDDTLTDRDSASAVYADHAARAQHADAKPHADADQYADGQPRTESDADQYADQYADGQPRTESDTDSDGKPRPVSHADGQPESDADAAAAIVQ